MKLSLPLVLLERNEPAREGRQDLPAIKIHPQVVQRRIPQVLLVWYGNGSLR